MIDLQSIKLCQPYQFQFKKGSTQKLTLLAQNKVTNLNLSPNIYFAANKKEPNQLLLPYEFKEKNENKLMIGTMSPEHASLANTKKDSINTINEIASTLDILFPILWKEKRKGNNIDIKFQLKNDKIVNAKYLGKGGSGKVFKIDIGSNSDALKIYENKNAFSAYSMWSELALADHLEGKKFKDMASFKIASPKNSWAMFEFISGDMTPESRDFTEKKSFKEFAEENKLCTPDQYEENPSNDINGIIIDYGGIRKKEKVIENFDQFNEYIKSGNLKKQIAAASDIFRLEDQKQARKAFDLAWQTKNIKIQTAAAGKIYSLKKEDRKKAFDLAWNTQNSEIQAMAIATTLFWLEGIDRKDAFYKAMKSKSSQVQVAAVNKFIDLENEDRKGAYYTAMATKNPKVQTITAKNITRLKKEDQKDAYDTAMATGNPGAQAAAFSKLEHTNEELNLNIIKDKCKYIKSIDLNIPNLKVS